MYLGVDGGGSKTAFALLDKSGQLLAVHEEPGSYYLEIGLPQVGELLQRGVNQVLQKAKLANEKKLSLADIEFAFFGLPAYGENSEIQDQLDNLPAAFLPRGKYRCGNDMVCAWAGSLGCAEGINIVAGTGSIGYGERAGMGARTGGWGELFGDEGSAYWIGRCGLELFGRMSDGRSERSYFYELVRNQLELADDLSLIKRVMNDWSADRSKIAQVSMLVYQAAVASDSAAKNIFHNAGCELASMVDALRKNLGFSAGDIVRVSWSGGVFKSGALILEPFEQGLAALYPHYRLTPPLVAPVIGAALYAARAKGQHFTEEELAELARESL